MLKKIKKLITSKTKVAPASKIKTGYSHGKKDAGSPEQWRKA